MLGVWQSVKKVGNPTKPGMYLVTIEFENWDTGELERYVDYMEYTSKSTWVYYNECLGHEDEEDDVIAWMDSPEEYHGE